MATPPFDPQEIFPHLQAVAKALIQSTPEHFETAFCCLEQAPKHADGRLEYRIGSTDHPDEETERPSPELHAAAYEVHRFYRKHGLGFPGLEVSVAAQPDGSFKTSFTMADPSALPRSDDDEQRLWQEVYDAREAFYVEHFGPMPEHIGKLMSLTGVWPGGGIFTMAAPKLGGMGVCSSFGLSNPDLPTAVTSTEQQRRVEGNKVSYSSTLGSRTPAWAPRDAAGYGYEVMVLTRAPEAWAPGPVSWVIHAEILKDVGLVDRILEIGAISVGDLDVGEGRRADFLIAPAAPPLPLSATLPNGTMRLLVATRITRDETDFARQHGQHTLLQRLVAAGVGQTSDLARGSILRG